MAHAQSPHSFSHFTRLMVLICGLLAATNSLAQQPKVMAPHKPVAPRLPRHREWDRPAVAQALTGGFWMTDATFNATLHLSNLVKTDPVTVTPIVYLSNGAAYPLPALTLEPSGTAAININQALASQGVAPYATLSGYVEVQYQWPWVAICGTVWNVDIVHSLIFINALKQPPAVSPAPNNQTGGAAVQPPQILEGMWWKQESNVTGFVALSNVTARPITATVQVLDARNQVVGDHSATVSPRGTKIVELNELLTVATASGGLVITWNGGEGELVVNANVKDEGAGYSAHLPLAPRPSASAETSEDSYAELGMMSGAADPMMNFPSGTVFTPYSVVRNVSEQPLTVAPTLWWMQGGMAHSVQLPGFVVASHQTQKLDLPALIAAAGLKNYNGSVNLVLYAKGQQGALLLGGGSVDQKYTYVFEVVPRGVQESTSKGLPQWSTGNGDDTMVTVWNPADEAQDFVFTLFYTGGHYLYPIHLEARATHTFNVSEILHQGAPDAEGNVMPAGVFEGAAEISGAQGENEAILVAVDAGIYNVRKATCGGLVCSTCNGEVGDWINSIPFAVGLGRSIQETSGYQYNTGNQYDTTSGSTWSSSNTNIATVNAGLTNGVGVGSVTLTSLYLESVPVFSVPCSNGPYPPSCPQSYTSPSPSGGGDGTPTVSFGPISYVVVGQTATISATVSPSTNTQPISLSISSPAAIVTPTGTSTTSTSVVVKGLSVGTATLNATVSNGDGSTPTVGSTSFVVVSSPPDHLVVVVDQQGPPASCPTTGIQVRQMQMRVVDANGNTVPNSPSVAEALNPLPVTNSCNTGSPIPSSCAATASDSTFIDTMAVAGSNGDFCHTGVNRSSGCGFTITSTWSACGGNPLWVSQRTTKSNLVTVDGNTTKFLAGVICNSSGCH